MSALRLILVLAGLCAGVVLGGGGAAQAAAPSAFCRDPAVNREVELAAHNGLDIDRLVALSRRFDAGSTLPDPGCGDKVSHCVGMNLSLAYVDRAQEVLGTDGPDLDQARTLLHDGQTHGSPWQLLAILGQVDIAFASQLAKPDPIRAGALYREAASTLQFALNQIMEPPLCGEFGEIRPSPEEVARIRKRAQEAVMLSPRFEIARTRSGECGGIFLDTTRAIDVEPVPVPITFNYDSDTLTAEGAAAANSLLECLRSKNLSEITLSGHTDMKGGDDYNMKLSARRLAAVEQHLRAGGYAGAIHLVPKGKREPFQPDDPGQHNQDEIDRMNRRVELREQKR